MKGLGFPEVDRDGSHAVRVEPGKRIRVGVTIRALGGIVYPNLAYVVRINRIEELWEDYIAELGLLNERGFYPTFMIGLLEAWPEVAARADYNEKVHSLSLELNEEGVQKFYTLFEYILKEKMFPLGEKLEDVAELDRIINRGPVEMATWLIQGKEWFLRRLIIARLANNPDLDKIYERDLAELQAREKTGEAFFQHYPDVMEKVFNKLKNVEPWV
jgi:hypothetical protein